MQEHKILWADDEIELLKPYILFLEQRGYVVAPVSSGSDLLEEINRHYFDIIFLDENMPGMSGLETLNHIKTTHPNLPVVMITKNEAEEIMEDAIGAKIADYLIKPLNPSQILLSVKKVLDDKRIVSEKTNLSYQKEFQQLAISVMDAADHFDWQDIYKKLIYWELQVADTKDRSMMDVLNTQKSEADASFSAFAISRYEDWIGNPDTERPIMSHQLLKRCVFNKITDDIPIFLIVIDNLRYDQWKVIEPDVAELFAIESEDLYYSILPSTTAYARNALFGGMLPLEIAQRYPHLWVGENVDQGKNNFERELLEINLTRNGIKSRFSYHKILKATQGKQLNESIDNLLVNPLNAIVINFVDMLSHARTDMPMIRELAPDESAYRSLTRSWFIHSTLYDILKTLSDRQVRVMITTDHGTIRVNKPYKIAGDKSTNANLRYKVGKRLNFDRKNVYCSQSLKKLGLPGVGFNSTFVFAKDDYFFAYPNNYNHYVRYYRDTFQHGGISMEEIIVPFISLTNK